MKTLNKIPVENYDYDLPEGKIASFPLPERDKSKLLVHAKGRPIVHDIFRNLPEYLDPEKINAAYEGIKLLREKKIRSIMEVLKSDYKDKKEYLPGEILQHAFEDLPKEMKTFWETWRHE